MPDEKTATRRKRLKGNALGELRTIMKRLERAVKGLNRKRDEILDARDLFKDQVAWGSGFIYDAKAEDPKTRTRIGRLTKDEEKSQRPLGHEVDAIDSELGDFIWDCSIKLGCLPKDIDPQSGEIKGTPVDGIDPDEEQPEVPEPEADTPDAAGVPLSLVDKP